MLLQHDFVETKLTTRFGIFNLRVYPDNNGKEHVVLWTSHLDLNQPILVRVHSECLTGDLLGSCHCDCGRQLNKSLQRISLEGGVLIYLRQEGRGIGLLEKIKSYQLQSQGHDTFEANVLLGHQPDQRSYEIVKKILDDLNIHQIRLLTNNPSKVSDIAKLGIDVVERIPLLSRPNKHNKHYLETKRKKFQHFINHSQCYFYQFHVDSIEKMDSIRELIKQKNKDPLLKFGVGISANHSTFTQKDAIEKIKEIIHFFNNSPEFVPILHFSFLNSADILKDVQTIKNFWPAIGRLQLNDWKNLELNQLKKICAFFLVDIPLSDENFDIVHNPRFREIVKKNRSFIVLDNSKGTGTKESYESFVKKINILLSYGLNDITLCGGFGPDHLNIYFAIRRFYRINLSIDAETNLKTTGMFDAEKIKLYLLQLMRFDDPKQTGIEQTRKFLHQFTRPEWENTMINGSEFSIHPEVFHAGYFPSTAWFASQLVKLLKNHSAFCEVGCGCGAISCLVALSNPNLYITATDISPDASENTRINAFKLGLKSRTSVYTGDVLDSIEPSAIFDAIFWALPFGFLDPGVEISLKEAQVFDPGYKAIRKLLQTAQNHLTPTGKLYLGFSSDLGHYELLETLAEEAQASIKVVAKTTLQEKDKLSFELLEVSYDAK